MTQRRIPRSLKRQLEADLSKLTPRDAGRLFAIYMAKASKMKADDVTVSEYPPIEELFRAFKTRVDQSRGKPTEREAVVAYNTLFFLSRLLRQIDRDIASDLGKALAVVKMIEGEVKLLSYIDKVNDMAGLIHNRLLAEMPLPATRDEYDRMIAYWGNDGPTRLIEIANDAANRWGFDEQTKRGFVSLEISEDFMKSYATKYLEDHPDTSDADYFGPLDEEGRRAYVKAEGRDRILRDVFKGEEALLEDWLKNGGQVGVTADEIYAKADEIFDRIVAMIKRGEIEGYQAFKHPVTFDFIPIREGTMSGAIALDILWVDWLRDQGVYERPFRKINTDTLKQTRVFYGPSGDLTPDDLKALVGGLIAEARAKPWGKGLPADIDVDALAKWLTEDDHPLRFVDFPDLGRVDYDIFRSYQGDESDSWEVTYTATLKSLRAKARSGEVDGLADEDIGDGTSWVESTYYPVEVGRARSTRADLQDLSTLILGLRQGGEGVYTRRFRRQGPPDEGEMSPEVFFGDIYRKVKEMVGAFGQACDRVATLKRTIEILSDEYFGGLPVLIDKNPTSLLLVEAGIYTVDHILGEWVKWTKRLVPFMRVDLTFLQPKKKGVDEEWAQREAKEIFDEAMRSAGLKPDGIDLGPTPKKKAKT